MMITTATQEHAILKEANADVYSSRSHQPAQPEKAEYGADVLMQLRANLAQLEDLHARLRFVMSEIAYLVKKS